MSNRQSTKRWPVAASLLLCFWFCSCSTAPQNRRATTSSPISYLHITRRDPNYSIHVVKVNLSDPRVSVQVSRGGPDPDGNGPWLTTLMPTSAIAQRRHFDIAVNGDFFNAKATKDIEGKNTGYVRGKAAAPVGTAMTDGNLWHRGTKHWPYLEITSNRKGKIIEDGVTASLDPNAQQIVGGSHVIVRDGKPVSYTSRFATARHPRTAVGLDATGTQLTLLVVDGRQPAQSIGMTLAELSDELIKLGCTSAINLDGGGSTTLVYRNPNTKKLDVLNSPSDTKERSVAEVLGVRVKGPLPEPR